MTEANLAYIKQNTHLTDKEIAAKIGRCVMTVYFARKANGLMKQQKRQDGDIAIRTTGGKKRKFIRIAPCKWMLYSRYVWQQHHGELPKGRLMFKDGDTLNCDISNLEPERVKPKKQVKVKKDTGVRHKDIFNGREFKCQRCGRTTRGDKEFPAFNYKTKGCPGVKAQQTQKSRCRNQKRMSE